MVCRLFHQLAAAVGAACKAFGERFAAAVVAPAFEQAALECRASSFPATTSQPASPAAHNQASALALLLCAVLLHCGPAAVGPCLLRLCAPSGDGGPPWALEHAAVFTPAVCVAAQAQAVQEQLLPALWELVMSRRSAARQGATALAAAAVPSLPRRQVQRQILPALRALACDADGGVSGAAFGAAAAVFTCLASDEDLQDALAGVLEDAAEQGGHAAELALLSALPPAAATAPQLDWLLRRAARLLDAVRARQASGRTAAQLSEAAGTAFAFLSQVACHEFTDAGLQRRYHAALVALQEGGADWLEPAQREVLAVLAQEHAEALH